MVNLSDKDRSLLRDLAGQVAKIAANPKHVENAARWTEHNDLRDARPMILVFPEGSWRELLPESLLQCESQFARDIELEFRKQIYYAEHLPDDNPITNIYKTPICSNSSAYGLESKRTHSEQATGADHFEPVIKDMRDIEKIHCPEVTVDWEKSRQIFEYFTDLFGDILEVCQYGACPSAMAVIDQYSKLRGFDNLFYDTIDQPEMIHEFCRRTVDYQIHIVRELERQGALTLCLDNSIAGSGGTCYTNDLPYAGFDGEHVRSLDFWGFATAQIFSEVSPETHEEFALQHEKRFLGLFGLNCYGCCEPLHNKLELVIKHIPRLRRISISPWADIEKSAAILQDKYIYSWKPNPAILAGNSLNSKLIHEELLSFCDKTRGCVTEIIMKDTHTVRNEPERLWEWVKIAKEVVEKY
ncbi:MAG: hypothetical protein PHV82_07870 [Victivallaceae bacterium]|nr:hypothetical protein [Victivallaceae bacterium]